MQGRPGGSWDNYYFICQIAVVLPAASFPPAHAACAGGRARRGGDGAEKSKCFGCGIIGSVAGLAQRSVRRRVSAALAQVFNVSRWNVLNTTFYKGTLVKHLH